MGLAPPHGLPVVLRSLKNHVLSAYADVCIPHIVQAALLKRKTQKPMFLRRSLAEAISHAANNERANASH